MAIHELMEIYIFFVSLLFEIGPYIANYDKLDLRVIYYFSIYSILTKHLLHVCNSIGKELIL